MLNFKTLKVKDWIVDDFSNPKEIEFASKILEEALLNQFPGYSIDSILGDAGYSSLEDSLRSLWKPGAIAEFANSTFAGPTATVEDYVYYYQMFWD